MVHYSNNNKVCGQNALRESEIALDDRRSDRISLRGFRRPRVYPLRKYIHAARTNYIACSLVVERVT